MPRIRQSLTDDHIRRIPAAIRAGAFPHVAAEACGLPLKEFKAVLKRGQSKGARDAHRQFSREVRQATAQARLKAEMQILKDNPAQWLRSGPGKGSSYGANWTQPAPAFKQSQNHADRRAILEEFVKLGSEMLYALDDLPLAHTRISHVLDGLNSEKEIGHR